MLFNFCANPYEIPLNKTKYINQIDDERSKMRTNIFTEKKKTAISIKNHHDRVPSTTDMARPFPFDSLAEMPLTKQHYKITQNRNMKYVEKWNLTEQKTSLVPTQMYNFYLTTRSITHSKMSFREKKVVKFPDQNSMPPQQKKSTETDT
uniref:(northern house mosquito) hypothetical protein n=1 Tax=Culex pipiens TaxID=7175 RepID=A0A8D8FJ88_CULPI